MPNRLAGESSPYLLQHADNPVDWQPWGADALDLARKRNCAVLLSIGYAACHWCHVMAHESFEEPETAELMNELFVCIKVDREERPDIDAIYMQAVQSMTGHGGWPMTVFLTPDGEPFYGGTYFPPVDRHGMPAFSRILRAVADSYAHRRDTVSASAASMRQIYLATSARAEAADDIDSAFLDRAFQAIASTYDSRFGGFGTAPKFPPTMVLDFLLRHWARTGESIALDIAKTTFVMMARGGIYDQIGGGFARYSVDSQWLVPHFEKMLYDNALLIRLGAHLYEATHDAEIRRVTEETAEWLGREMSSPDGGFYSSLDADSEGEEGKFYVWRPEEIDAALGADSNLIKAFYGVTQAGNFEGRNILHVAARLPDFARSAGLDDAPLIATIARAKKTLYDLRSHRVWPARDDKVLAGWNGLALRGVAEAARAFNRDDFRKMALRNAAFLLDTMVVNGRVMRSHRNGVTQIPGFLEDQASVALGFLSVFEQTLDAKWLDASRRLSQVMLAEFYDEHTQKFYDTSHDSEKLVSRPHDPTDNAIPSGVSLAVDLLLRLANYDDDPSFHDRAVHIIASLAGMIARYPSAFGHMLGDAEYAETFACHGDYCDMPSPEALELSRRTATSPDRHTNAE